MHDLKSSPLGLSLHYDGLGGDLEQIRCQRSQIKETRFFLSSWKGQLQSHLTSKSGCLFVCFGQVSLLHSENIWSSNGGLKLMTKWRSEKKAVYPLKCVWGKHRLQDSQRLSLHHLDPLPASTPSIQHRARQVTGTSWVYGCAMKQILNFLGFCPSCPSGWLR